MKRLFGILSLIIFLFSSCDEDTLQIGNSVVPAIDAVVVGTDTFDVTSRTVIVDSVVAENGMGYIGRVRDAETNAYVTADLLSQFHVIESMSFDNADSIISRDSQGLIVSDTSVVCLYIDSWYGDSTNQMQLTTYELSKPLEENKVYYSNFDIEKEGYIRPASEGGIEQTTIWTAADLIESDTIRAEDYGRRIFIPMNSPYTAKNGTTYKNFSSYLFRTAFEHPEYFKNSYTFSHNVFPGFYFKTTNSVGTMAKIKLTEVMIRYQFKLTEDSTQYRWISFYGTDEVLQLSKTNTDKEVIKQLAADETCTYLKTPSCLFTELTLPVEKIFNGHERDTINTAEVTLQKINNENKDEYALSAPSKIMMIEKDSLDSFFELGHMSDEDNFYLSSLSSSVNGYAFTNISSLVTKMFNAKKAGEEKDPQWVAKHPNWDKVLLVPVSVIYNSSGVVTKISHDMSMTSTRLVGGKQNSHQPIRLKVIYSKFNSK